MEGGILGDFACLGRFCLVSEFGILVLFSSCWAVSLSILVILETLRFGWFGDFEEVWCRCGGLGLV